MTVVTKRLPADIDTVIVRVRDIAVSRDWYIDQLGFKQVWADPEAKVVVLDTNSPISLTLWETKKEVVPRIEGKFYPVFRTKNIETLRQKLIKHSINAHNILEEDVRYFFFFDAAGNVLEVPEHMKN